MTQGRFTRRSIFVLGTWLTGVFLGVGWLLPLALGQTAESAPSPHLPGLTVRVWGDTQGLPALEVRDLAQTRDGFIWAATGAGLHRNNGRGFARWPLPENADGKPVRVAALHADPSGGLWGADDGRMVLRIQDSVSRVWTLPEVAGIQGRRCLASTPDGGLWLTAGEWLLRHEAGGFVTVARSEGRPWRRCAVGPDGRLWAVGRAGLARWNGQALATPPGWDPSRRSDLRDLIWTPDGTLWVADEDEVLSLAPGASAPIDHGVRSQGRAADLQRLILDRDHRLWALGTRSAHCWMRRSFWEADLTLDPQQGHVLAALPDDEGSLWLGFDQGGLAQLVPTPARWFNPLSPAERARRGLSAAGDAAAVADPAGTVWLANAWGGLAYVADDEKWTPVTRYRAIDGTPARPRRDFRILAPSASGGIWAGTADGRLYQVTTNEALAVPPDRVPGGGPVTALHEGRSGRLWVARAEGPVFSIEPARTDAKAATTPLPAGGVRHLYEAADGTVWAGGDRLWRIRDRAVAPVAVEGDAAPLDAVGFWVDPRGDLWVTSRRLGWCLVRGGTVEPIGPGPHHAGGLMAGPTGDRAGRLWLVGRHGVCWTTPQALLDAKASPRNPVPMHLIPLPASAPPGRFEPTGTPELACDDRGIVWMATSLGALLIDSSRLVPQARPPRLQIAAVRVDGQPVPDMRAIAFPAGTTRLEVDFDVPTFVWPDAVRVLARFGGAGVGWQDVSATRTVVWTNPPPGSHELHLQAFLAHQEQLPVAAVLPWSQRQPWWRRGWIHAAGVGGLLGALSFHLWMTRRIDRRQLAAIQTERGRLARELHDTVEQGLQVAALRLSALAESLPREPGEPARLRSKLDELRDLALHTLTEARRAVWELGPDTGHWPTLAQALEADARRLVGAGLGLAWTTTGQAWPVSADCARELRRIQSEAITNTLKHAQASEITVRLAWQPDALTLDIKDDGRGFEAACADGSGMLRLGLDGMRTRADRIGARWTLSSHPGEGTCINVTLPYTRERPTRAHPAGVTPPPPTPSS